MQKFVLIAELSDGTEAAECHCLATSEISMQSEEIYLGDYVIEWRRSVLMKVII